MSERYSGRKADVAAASSEAPDARALIARLFPEADGELLVRALTEELGAAPRAGAAVEGTTGARVTRESELSPAERELHRVRDLLALGEIARSLQHSLNNPLTALLAEAQLLQLDPLPEEQRLAVARIVELARRMVTLTRRLGG